MFRTRSLVLAACLVIPSAASAGDGKSRVDKPIDDQALEHKLLATSKTSSMQKKMSKAARAGYRFSSVMGGETTFGGSEVVVIMSHPLPGPAPERYAYRLLATAKTSTMQKELQAAADEGFLYVGQTVFETTFGGDEVVVILERDLEREPRTDHYKLLATKKTSTLQKELRQAGARGYELLGMTVAATTFGGNELVAILRRRGGQPEQAGSRD